MATPRIRYRIAVQHPATHLARVTMDVDEARSPLEVRFPVWIPGSYLVREFGRQVQDFRAEGTAGRPLEWRKTRKDTWRVELPEPGTVKVEFDYYAHELSVRTSHVDAT